MKKIYIKSVIELEKNNQNQNQHHLIGDLILYDLNNNSVYYIFNTAEILANSKRTLKFTLNSNNYMDLGLKEAYPISEQKFNELLNTSSRDFYNMYKDDLLKELNLEELII